MAGKYQGNVSILRNSLKYDEWNAYLSYQSERQEKD